MSVLVYKGKSKLNTGEHTYNPRPIGSQLKMKNDNPRPSWTTDGDFVSRVNDIKSLKSQTQGSRFQNKK